MKNRLVICIFIFCIPFWVNGEYKTGFYLSMGQMHYSLKSFANTPDSKDMEPKDLLMEASIQLKNKVEINFLYNRFNGEVTINSKKLTFDKDGFGIEIGKLVSMEFIAGAYYIFYPLKKTHYSGLTSDNGFKRDKLDYQTGFYFTIRLKNIFAKKASFDLGFKSLLPFKSNEFVSSEGRVYLLFKSFIFVGITF